MKKLKKLLFTTEEERTKVVISTEIMEKTLKKIRDENECKLKELMENMPKLNLIAECNITPTELMIGKDNATVNKLFKDVRKGEILERTMTPQEREIMAVMQPSTYNFKDFRLVDFQCELHKAASCRNVSDIHKMELTLTNAAVVVIRLYTKQS